MPAPALLIRISMAPKRSRVRSTTRRRAWSVVMSPGVTRASGGGAAQALFIARGEGEPGSGRGELAGAGGADAFGGSGNEHHFAVNSHGIAPAQAAVVAQKRHNGTMPKGLIPLFPLQLVVFPRTHLPLHIFEDRYKEMVGDAIRDGSEFGIVLAKEDGILNAGCTVMVEKVLEMYPDGRMDILTCGSGAASRS